MTTKLRGFVFAVLLPVLLVAATPTWKSDVSSLSVRSDSAKLAAGYPALIELSVDLKPGWHIYGPNAPKPGIPTKLSLSHHDDLVASEIRWPDLVEFEFLEKKGMGYEGSTQFYVDVTPTQLTQDNYPIQISASWLICKDACIPQKATVTLALEASETNAPVYTPEASDIRAGAAGTKARTKTEFTWLTALLFAFIGGLILNIMPCVFPVLSLKVLSLAKMRDQKQAHLQLQGIAYTLGIMASSLILLLALAILKLTGEAVGWGFQLQSPVFIGLMLIVVAYMGAYLMGWIDLPQSVYRIPGLFSKPAAEAQKHDGLLGQFLTGVLVTALATPCTAPFMAPAIGFALVQPIYISAIIFMSLALGLGFPYLLIAFVPGLASKFPKPGPWLVKVKKALSIPLFLTAIWLVWVLVILLKPVSSDFSEAKIQAQLDQGNAVLVDVTAAWCITCQVNKRVLFADDNPKKMAEKGIIYMKADWTKEDPEITKYLEKFGRAGVPLMVLYEPNKAPVILPQVLTPGNVKALLE